MRAYLTTIYKKGQEYEKYLDFSKENAKAFISLAKIVDKEIIGRIKEVEVKEIENN